MTAAKPTVLVVAEIDAGAVSALTLELLGLARSLAGELGSAVGAVLVSDDARSAAALITHGADRVYASRPTADEYEGEAWLPLVEHVARETKPLAIIVGHTPTGAHLAPRLAFRLQSAAATGCVGVKAASGRLHFTRPCYGGNVRETISFNATPCIATVKPGVGTPVADAARGGEIVALNVQPVRPRSRVIARDVESTGERLEDAKVIVAGGRGLEGPEGFQVLEEFADVIGARVGASRVPCDLGWCPPSRQIGLTGKTVTPDLYFAVGISGAGHHMAGCGNAKTIVAINTDPDAAIFREARFGIVGDYRKVVPALTSAVARMKEESELKSA
jgi:electron transfer flavoprotein alpha subunit